MTIKEWLLLYIIKKVTQTKALAVIQRLLKLVRDKTKCDFIRARAYRNNLAGKYKKL